MKIFDGRGGIAAALALALLGANVQIGAAATKPASGSEPLLPGSNSKEPISIEADKLVYFDKEQKAIYTGNVVVIQGDTKMTCSAMTIFMEKAPEPAQPGAAKPVTPVAAGDQPGAAPSAGTSRVRHLDAVGPVTVLSKTQVATGDSASYDKAKNKVWLIGHVTLSDGGNVTKGDKLTYDMATGQATVETGAATNRVRGLFIPGSSNSEGDDKTKAAK